VHSVLDVVFVEVQLFETDILVLSVALNELDQEDVGLLDYFQIGILVLCLFQRLLLDYLKRHFLSTKVAQQPLVLLVEHVIVREDALVFIVPLLVKL
jgi:hypothetical protein